MTAPEIPEQVDLRKGEVSLRLIGSHAACPMALATLQAGIEAYLRERVPEVTQLQLTR